MSRGVIVTALVTGTALVGAGYYLTRPKRPRALPTSVVSIITPVIDLGVAEEVLAAMQRIPGDEITVVLHTAGGCVTSCVLIANALREFPRSTAIVPYMAISGGTLIALNARALQMGRSASLSAVDPIVFGQRARHISPQEQAPGVHALAKEYERAMSRYLRETLAARLPDASDAQLERALGVFLGEDAPHEWPIRRHQVEALGLPVSPATRVWSDMVDGYRGRWW